MNDRELLELAAKAAWYKCFDMLEDHDFWPVILHEDPRGNRFVHWNPLTDDGDAMRLANTLHLCVCHTLGGLAGAHGTAMVGMNLWENAAPLATERYEGSGDMDAATRRAIVRAAAEIGRAMP